MGIKTWFQACSVTGKNIVTPCSQPDLQTLRYVFYLPFPCGIRPRGHTMGNELHIVQLFLFYTGGCDTCTSNQPRHSIIAYSFFHACH